MTLSAGFTTILAILLRVAKFCLVDNTEDPFKMMEGKSA